MTLVTLLSLSCRKLADYFALCTLMPREWIVEKWAEVEDLDKMAYCVIDLGTLSIPVSVQTSGNHLALDKERLML